MSGMDWFMLFLAAAFLAFWVLCGEEFEEEPKWTNYVEIDTNEEDFLETFNND